MALSRRNVAAETSTVGDRDDDQLFQLDDTRSRRGHGPVLISALVLLAAGASGVLALDGQPAAERASVRIEAGNRTGLPLGLLPGPGPAGPLPPVTAEAPLMPDATSTTTTVTAPVVPIKAPSTFLPDPPPPQPVSRPSSTGLWVVDANRGGLTLVAKGEVHHPVWSPDGTRLAFIRDSRLLVARADGGGEHIVTALGQLWFPAAWSPDSDHLAFIDEGGLFVARPDGTERRQVADGGVNAVAWSPESARLAVISHAPMQSRLEVLALDGSATRVLSTTAGVDGHLVWSPDATRIGFLSWDVGPAVADVATGTVTPLTAPRNMGWRMSWSPVGDELAFADYVWNDNLLSIARADGSGVRTIAAGAVAPAWSPDGSRIAFSANRNPDDRGELLTHLMVIGPDGGGERILVADTRGTSVGEGAWAPDGVRLAFRFFAR